MWTPEVKGLVEKRLKALKPFDPFHSPLCTCGPKLTLNVYNGCGNECFYCYASSYLRGRWGRDKTTWGLRRGVVERLQEDIARIRGGEDEALGSLRGFFVAVSLSSDPYPDTPYVRESEIGATRECLRLLTEGGFRLLVQTKSDLVVRDLDVLRPAQAVIGLTITSDDDDLASKMEPYAPSPSRRIAAVRACAKAGFPTVCRIDPLVPGLNTAEGDLARLVGRLAEAGVRQIITSTFKKKPDSGARFEERFGRAARASAHLYEDRRTEGYVYMRRAHRVDLLTMVERIVRRHGLAFSCCREGLAVGGTACDGRGLLAEGSVGDE